MRKLIKILFIFSYLLLSACSSLFDKDNTPAPAPLTAYTPEVKPARFWSVNTGANLSAEEYIKLNPVVTADSIYTTSSRGTVSAINKTNGLLRWQKRTGLATAAGPGVGGNLVAVCGRSGDVMALQQSDGQVIWKKNLLSHILAAPAVTGNKVVVKTTDGSVHALSAENGEELWSFQQTEPNLILHASSAPLVYDNSILAGFANGSLVKLDQRNGELIWVRSIATPQGIFAIQRMIDIDANPLVYHHHLYAATYQGNISALDGVSGNPRWSHQLSSYTGMVADDATVYVTDTQSQVWAFNAQSGQVKWRQTQLGWRVLSGPAISGNYIVVGDKEGYLHWLDKRDGHLAGRDKLGAAIYAAPLADQTMVYVLANNGQLSAYSLAR